MSTDHVGDKLHHVDGTHRTTPPTASGRALEIHQAALERHVVDGHTHETATMHTPTSTGPGCENCGGSRSYLFTTPERHQLCINCTAEFISWIMENGINEDPEHWAGTMYEVTP